MIFFLTTIILVAALIWFIFRADGDLTLLFQEKYGKQLDSLKGKVIWITGASSGIGEALVYALCSVKAKVVISGTNEERLLRVSQTCFEKYGIERNDVLILPFNMSDFDIHAEKFNLVLNHFGKLDILVNNAGRSQRAAFEDIDLRVDKDLFDTNVFGPVNLSRVVIPYFLKNKMGHLVVTSSTAGIVGAPFSSTYTASKHAIHGYFESIRSETSKYGISVTVCCPGPVESNIIKNCATGKFGETYAGPTTSSKRMTPERCAKLMLVAIANKLDHTWITPQPILTVHYLGQYAPSILRNWIIPAIPKKIIDNIRGGPATPK